MCEGAGAPAGPFVLCLLGIFAASWQIVSRHSPKRAFGCRYVLADKRTLARRAVV